MRYSPLAPLLAVLALAACETMQGAGRDMQTAGRVITDQAYSNNPNPSAAGAPATDPYAPTPAPY